MRTRRQLLAEAKAAHNHPAYARMAFVMGCGVQERGEGSRVLDDAGRSFLAMFDQYGNQSFGYSHPRIVAAVREQLDTGVLNSTKIMFEDVQIRLAEELSALTGHRLPYAYLANGGGESVDNALKLARAATGRPGVVSARGCFHGKTFATLSASGRAEHRELLGPFLPRFEQVPFGDTEALARALAGREVAAVLLEPVQAEAGVIVPQPDYLKEVRRLCDASGTLLVLDEMQTAFGRCGTFFAHERLGVTPDLLCVGKAFGGGVLPISAVLGTARVWDVLRELPSTFGSSLGGNPLCCRVGLESIALACDPAFLDGVNARAAVLTDRLSALARRFPGLVREHRGIGMMHGLEFHDDALVGLVLGRLLEEGVTSTYSLYNPRVLRIQPPMVISAADLDLGLTTLEEVLAEAAAHGEALREAAAGARSPVTATAAWPAPAAEVVALLHARPHLLDPFADGQEPPGGADPGPAQAAEQEQEFAGRLGADRIVWSDRATPLEDGVLLSADPGWLWRQLERRVSVAADPAGGGCTVTVHVAWDTGSEEYEDMLGGRIGAFVRGRLEDLLTPPPGTTEGRMP